LNTIFLTASNMIEKHTVIERLRTKVIPEMYLDLCCPL